MRTLTSSLHVARNLLSQAQGWLLFVEIPLLSGTSWYRLVQNNRHVTAAGKVWQAASIAVELPEEDAEGSLAENSLTIPNVSRLPMAAVELDDEILGQTITIWLQHESEFAAFSDALKWEQVALRCKANEKVIRVECGHPARLARVPRVRFGRQNFPQLLASGAARL